MRDLSGLYILSDRKSLRASSWDRYGRNADFIRVMPGGVAKLLEVEGPGCINHIYWTMIFNDPFDLRSAVLRMAWDGEESPSVEVPLGDFFCAGHAIVRPFSSLLVCVNPGMGGSCGFNSYFPMPFSEGARIEIENQGDRVLGGAIGAFWYHIDYELWPGPPGDDAGRFHAQWRRENLTGAVDEKMKNVQLWSGKNLTGEDNYMILEAGGRGRLAGIHLMIDNVAGGWYGEGDDMIFIDGEAWPPSIHGTGSEEIFGGGASPTHEYEGPYSGFHLVENPDWSGKHAMYRWMVHDPVHFSKSVSVSVEHGHANNFENDYASVAYWYQKEPHMPFPELPPAGERLPRVSGEYLEARDMMLKMGMKEFSDLQKLDPESRHRAESLLQEAFRELHAGKPSDAVKAYRKFKDSI